jgi:hypothetical protein
MVGLTTDAVGDAHDKSVSHFSTTALSYSEGGGGGGETSTTTTVVPATTTTTIPPNQIQTADYDGEIVVTFTETDGVVGYENVEAEGWMVDILVEDEDVVRLRCTREDPYLRVIARGWLLDDPEGEDDGELKAKTRELDD